MKEAGEQPVEIQIPPCSLKLLAVGDRTYGSACDFQVTETDLEKARRELNETEELRNAALLELKGMLCGDTDFNYRKDDDYLLRYLRYRKFKTKEACKFIRNFYKTRKQCPEMFRVSPNLEKILDSKFISLMPYTDGDGDLIFIVKYANWNPSEMSVCEVLQQYCFVSDIITMNPHAQINGVKQIWDFAGTNFSHYIQILNPANLRLWTMVVQELYPWRLRRAIIFRCNPVMHASFAVVRFFLKQKIAERVALLGSDLSQVHEYINPDVLPKEYGGNLENDECYTYIKNPILANTRYLEYELSFSGIPNL